MPRRTPPPLLSPVPQSALVTMAATRRTFLRSAALGGAMLGMPTLLSACGGDDSGGGGGGGGGDSVRFGMNEARGSGPAYQRLAAMAAAYTDSSGVTVEENPVDHNTFQNDITTYLQGSPDDVFTWFAGFRMRQFADQGLISDISDVWPIDGIGESFQEASTADDGNQYFVPVSYYPWAVFYKKSVFKQNGYEVPATLDDLTALATQMQSDDIIPFAFGDKDGWPALGTFDILNMRINGFDYHISLMNGEEEWDSAEVRSVFETWQSLLPFHQSDPLGRTWQEAATSMGSGEAGMYLLGTFVIDAIADSADDLDFFTFPELDASVGADALDAPIDGFCLAAAGRNQDAGKDFLRFLGTAEASDAANSQADAPAIAANENASTETYTALQKKSVEVVGAASNIAQFLDRDTRSDFAPVVIQAIQTWLESPDDIDSTLSSIQEQKESIFV